MAKISLKKMGKGMSFFTLLRSGFAVFKSSYNGFELATFNSINALIMQILRSHA